MFLKFYSLFLFIKANFRYLPREISEELIHDLEDTKELILYIKVQKEKK